MKAPLSQPPPDAPLWPPPAGYREDWSPDPDWRLATELEKVSKKCRRTGCCNPVEAALHRHGWWLYCEGHLYGRRIANGRVEMRYLVPEEG